MSGRSKEYPKAEHHTNLETATRRYKELQKEHSNEHSVKAFGMQSTLLQFADLYEELLAIVDELDSRQSDND